MMTKHRTARQQTNAPTPSYYEGLHHHLYGSEPDVGTDSCEDTGPHRHGWWEPDSPHAYETSLASGEGHTHEVGR